MSVQYAKFIRRFRWAIVLIWLLATICSLLWLPNLNQVVARQNMSFLPDSSSVMVAQKLANQVDPKHYSKSSALVAIHRDGRLSAGDREYFYRQLSDLDAHPSHYGVSVVRYAGNSDKSVASTFQSHDGTTEIALVGFPGELTDQSTANALKALKQVFGHAPSGANVYFTGDVPIQQDDIDVSQKGAEKTAIVTVILVLTILLVVFRSIVAPFVTLVAIGVSFMISSGVVAFLAERGLPVSTFTQTFLIAILFGAGTDYSIIMLNRFREELTKAHDNQTAALAAAIQAVAKTVVFSALTVLVSFAVLYFANFGLYRSAVGVSIGILITLLTCLLLIPALMSLMGGYLFWPRKPRPGALHKPSRMWLATGRVSTSRPWVTLAALVVVLLPIALLFSNERTFDPMADIPNSPAVKGFHTVATSFGQGRVMPMTLVLNTNENLRSSKGLTTIESISSAVAALPSVTEVDSATRPLGKVIEDFQLARQNVKAANGLQQIHQGMAELGSKMNTSDKSLSSAPTGVDQLAEGSEQVTRGMRQLDSGLGALSANTGKLSVGAKQLETGMGQFATSLGQISDGATSLQKGATKLRAGLEQTSNASHQLASGAKNLSDSEQKLAGLAKNLSDAIAAWAAAHPNAAADPQWQQIEALAKAEASGAQDAANASGQLAAGASQLASAMPGLVEGASSLEQGSGQVADGAKQLKYGASRLQTGARQLASGTTGIASGTRKLSSASNALVSGSDQVTRGIQQFESSVDQLAPGLATAGSGVNAMTSGLEKVQRFLKESGAAASSGNPGFYVPESAVKTDKGLAKVMDAYISPDGHVAKFTVILNANPYSMSAISDVPNIEQVARAALIASPIHAGQILSAGTTAVQAELNRISNQDFVRTMTIVLVSIFLLLAVMLRSIVAPVYIILSLSATYFVTMGLLQQIATHILHQPGISWAVPFFVFLLLVALGVDYSIFLMARFDEEYRRGHSPVEAIRIAMGTMGNVIISAAFIMAGTFGSMIATGMTTMMEIGLSVIIGLLLYTAVLLAFFIPASVSVVGAAYRWPFVTKPESAFVPRLEYDKP